MSDLNLAFGVVTSGASGGAEVPLNPANVNDANAGTTSIRAGNVVGGTAESYWQSDLGATYTVTSMTIEEDGSVGWDAGAIVQRSPDGSSWTTVTQTETHPSTHVFVYTFSAPQAYRYWRIVQRDVSGGFHFLGNQGIASWTIEGDPSSVTGGPPLEPPYVAPSPGAAVVEIYAAEPGAYRWGSAIWGDPSVWSTAGWRNVTPESIDVEIIWGSGRPELGILSKVEPASWAIDFYDPDRALDPANAEGPYYGDLEPGLPVRVRHGEFVVKQGVAESIGYEHSREFGAQDRAYMRVTDVVSVMANARVPDDVTLSDTLWARAADAIAAAGLTVTMLAVRPDGDPVLAPWVTGQDRSAWEWIVDAAESVLYMPIITNLGYLGFRPYSEPFDRGRRLTSPNLVGLQSIIAHNGLYSVVTALQSPGDGGAVITRELTPKPRYGGRQYDRDEVTPNAGDWALAVLSDRAVAGLRWVPGEVYPLTADDVNYFAQIEGMEVVGISYPEAAPAVVQDVIIVGGRITVTAKKDSEAVWSFSFEAAQAAPSPLVDDYTATTLLARDDDPTALLYPDG